MSELSLLNLLGSGLENITVVNRTKERAQQLAEKHQTNYADINDLDELLVNADIVISSTSAQNYIITQDMMNKVLRKRRHEPMVLIDIAVPRDIDPAIESDMNIFNYDIDDLKGLVDANLREREAAAAQIADQIPTEINEHNDWVNMLGVVPVIRALREKAMNIQQDTMASIDRKLPDLSERERKVISKHTKASLTKC